MTVVHGPGRRGIPIGETDVEGVAVERDVLDVQVDVDGRILVLFRPGDAVAESHDQGRSWSVFTSAPPITRLAPGRLIWFALGELDPAGRATRLVRSRDRGRSWEPRVTGKRLEGSLEVLARPSLREVMFGMQRYLLHSTDRGETWRWSNPELEATVTALSCEYSAADGFCARWWVGGRRGRIAVGTPSNGWRGESLRKGQGPTIRGFARASRPGGAGGALFAASDAGLYRRAADGAWQPVRILGTRSYLGVRFDHDGRGVVFGESGELAVTSDGGETWERLTDRARQSLSADGAAADGAAHEDGSKLAWRFALFVEAGVLLLGDGPRVLLLHHTSPGEAL